MDESIYIGGGVSSVEYWLSWSAGRGRTIVVTLDELFRVKLKTAWLPTPFASFPFTSPVRRRVPPDSVSTLPSNAKMLHWTNSPSQFIM